MAKDDQDMADYACSTQHLYWEGKSTSASEGSASRQDHEGMRLPEPRCLVNYYLQQQTSKLGRRLQLRQIVMATTQVFLLRFYSKVDIHRTNPYLMLTTALYLACKIEECPQHIRVIANEARNLWPDSVQADTAKLGECEFLLISELNAHLIIHHPYAKLVGLKEQLSLTEDEMSLAWSVVNDHYVTSLPLRFAPGIIAVAAVMMATIVRPSQSRVTGSSMRAAPGRPAQSQREEVLTWIAQSKINMSSLVECVQALISLYAALETYNERECKEIFSSIVKRNN